jgi:hypothetical protein
MSAIKTTRKIFNRFDPVAKPGEKFKRNTRSISEFVPMEDVDDKDQKLAELWKENLLLKSRLKTYKDLSGQVLPDLEDLVEESEREKRRAVDEKFSEKMGRRLQTWMQPELSRRNNINIKRQERRNLFDEECKQKTGEMYDRENEIRKEESFPTSSNSPKERREILKQRIENRRREEEKKRLEESMRFRDEDRKKRNELYMQEERQRRILEEQEMKEQQERQRSIREKQERQRRMQEEEQKLKEKQDLKEKQQRQPQQKQQEPCDNIDDLRLETSLNRRKIDKILDKFDVKAMTDPNETKDSYQTRLAIDAFNLVCEKGTIKKFQTLSLIYHPDKLSPFYTNEEAKEKYQNILEMYKLLKAKRIDLQ